MLGSPRADRRLGKPSPRLAPPDTKHISDEMDRKARESAGRLLEMLATQQGARDLSAEIQQKGVTTKDQMLQVVKTLYRVKDDQGKITENHLKGLAALCWELDLSPNPSLGQTWIALIGGVPTLLIGITGWVVLARRSYDFIMGDARPMTEAERQLHNLGSEDVGMMHWIIDMRDARNIKELAGGNAKLDEIMEAAKRWYPGIWKKEIEKKAGGTRQDNVWAFGSPAQTAEKRAKAKALKAGGIEAKVSSIAETSGFVYDPTRGGYVMESDASTTYELPEGGDIEEGNFEPVDIESAMNQQIAEENQQSAEPRYAPATLIQKLQALTQTNGAAGHDAPLRGDSTKLRNLNILLSELIGAAGVASGKALNAARITFVKSIFDVESTNDLTIGAHMAILKWAEEREKAVAEVKALLAWAESDTAESEVA